MPGPCKLYRPNNIETHRGHRSTSGARNEIKIKCLDLYHYGVEGKHDFIELKSKHLLRGDTQYIDTYFTDPGTNTVRLSITGVIDIYHDRLRYPVDRPYDHMTFNGNTSHIRFGKYWIDDYHGEVKHTYNYNTYRNDLISDICSAKPVNGSSNKYRLQNWLSEKSIAFPYGVMAQKRYGHLELLPGYYVKCFHCSALTYVPLGTLINPDVTKQQLTDMLRDFKKLGPEYMPDMEIYGEMSMCVPMCFVGNNSNCFNCDHDLFSETITLFDTVYADSVAYHNSLNGTHIEEMLKLNLLQGAPPDEMPTARQQFNTLHNRHAARAIAKMNAAQINTLYVMNSSYKAALLQARNHIRVSNNAHINSTYMSVLDAEEIILLTDLASNYNGHILHHPTSIFVSTSLINVCQVICNTPYFTTSGVLVDIPVAPDYYHEIIPAQFALSHTIDRLCDGCYLLLLRPDTNNVLHSDAEWYYTAPTDGEILIQWNKEVIDLFADASEISVNNTTYQVNTVTSGDYLQVISITASTTTGHIRTLQTTPRFEAYIPTYDFNSPLSSLGVFGTTWSFTSIDVELLRRLLTFALTADKSVTSIEAYFAGILSTHYTIGGRVVDLTNTPITEGVPEIIYCMMILNNRKLVTMWAAYMHLNNYSSSKALHALFDFFISRIMRTALAITESVTPWFKDILSKPTEFIKRLVSNQHELDVESIFSKLMPLVILDSSKVVGDTHSNVLTYNSTQICDHHIQSCKHNSGDLTCVCCMIKSDMNICSCCIRHKKCTHTCRHNCVDSYHYCDSCRGGKPCHLQMVCNCCGVYGCHPCVICPAAEAVKVEPIKSGFIRQVVRDTSSRALGIPGTKVEDKPRITVPAAPRVYDATHGTVGGKTKFKPNDKIHYLRTDLMNIDDPKHLFIIDDDSLYIPMLSFTGMYRVKISFDVVVSDPNPVYKYCAYETISKQTQYSTSALINLHGDRPMMDAQELRHLLSLLRLNALLIVNSEFAEIHRYNSQDKPYILIAHGSITDEIEHNHWFIPHIPKFIDFPTGYYSQRDLGDPIETLTDFNMWKATSVEVARVQKRMKILSDQRKTTDNAILELPVVNYIDNAPWLTNSRVHNPRNGLINCSLPSDLPSEWLSALTGAESKIVDASYASLTHKWANVEQDTKSTIKLRCLEINLFIKKLYNKSFQQNEYTTVNIDDDSQIVPKTLLKKLKPLDVVVLEHSNCREICIVSGSASDPIVLNKLGKGSVLYRFKQSLASLYRALMLALKAYRNLPHLKSLTIGTCVDGVAGSGKSTMVREMAGKSQMSLVCKTRSAVESHSTSGFAHAYTVESAGLQDLTSSTVVIDEVSMITNVELASIVDKANMVVHLFGDSNQIGVKDMSDIKGVRDEDCLLLQLNPKVITHTHRIGEPVVSKLLKQFVPSITCDAGRKTELVHHKLGSYDDIKSLVKQHSIDAVYTFMDADFMRLSDILSNECPVLKVHAAQGQEFDNVLVLHWGNFHSSSSIVRSSKFLFTAATRAKKLLVWVSPDTMHIELANLLDISYIGSGTQTVALFDVDTLALLRDLTPLELELLNGIITSHPAYDPSTTTITLAPDRIQIKSVYRKVIKVSFSITKNGYEPHNSAAHRMQYVIKDMARKEFSANFERLQQSILEHTSMRDDIVSQPPTEGLDHPPRGTIVHDATGPHCPLPVTEDDPAPEILGSAFSPANSISAEEDALETPRASHPPWSEYGGMDPSVVETADPRQSFRSASPEPQSAPTTLSPRFQAREELRVSTDNSGSPATPPYEPRTIHTIFADETPLTSSPARDPDLNVNFETPTSWYTVATNAGRSDHANSGSISSGGVGTSFQPQLTDDTIVTSLHLTKRIWSRLIVIANIALSAQATNTVLGFKYNGDMYQIKVFKGCSLYCGFRFTINGTTSILSSAHSTEGSDGLLTTLNTANRHLFSTNIDRGKILLFLEDDAVFSATPNDLSVKLYLERLTLMFKVFSATCSFDQFGFTFGDTNKAHAVRCNSYNSTWKIPTHQEVSKYLVPCEDGYTVEPINAIVHHIHSLVTMYSGIGGNDVVFDLNKKNTAAMERHLIRFMNAEEKFDRPIYLPFQCLKSQQLSDLRMSISSEIMHGVSVGALNISSVHVAMLLAGVTIKRVYNVNSVHYIGIDTALFCMNYNFGDTIEPLPCVDKTQIRIMLDGKVRDLLDKVEVEVDHYTNMSTEELVNYYSDINNIIHRSYRKPTISHPKYFNTICPQNGVTVVPTGKDASCFIRNGQYFENDHNGGCFTVDTSDTIRLLQVGNYYLMRKVTSKPRITLCCDVITHQNVRVFRSSLEQCNVVHIPDPIFRRLYARAFADTNTTLADLIAYSRSLLNTMTYTSKGYSFKYNDDPLELLKFCVVVLNISKRQRKLTSAIDKILRPSVEQNSTSGLTELLINGIKTVGINLLQNQLREPLKVLNDVINGVCNETPIIKDCFAALQDVNFIEVKPVVKLLQYADQEDSDQGDDDPPSDDDQISPPEISTKDETEAQHPAVSDKGKQRDSDHSHFQPPDTINTHDYHETTTESKHSLITKIRHKVVNELTTLKAAWNKFVSDNNKELNEWRKTNTQGDVLLLYSGSRGDAQPLNAIAEIAAANNLRVKALVPADQSYRIKGVEYIEYCKSYDFLTNAGVNDTPPNSVELLRFVLNVHKHWMKESQKHKYVVGLFFSAEANLVVGTNKNIRIIPQLDSKWDAHARCKLDDKSGFLNKLLHLKQLAIEPYWSVPLDCRMHDDNLGFLIPEHSLLVDNNTVTARRFARKFENNVHLVTLGSMVPNDYIQIISNMLTSSPNPVILVLNKLLNKPGNFTYNGATHNFKQIGIFGELCVLPTVNYLTLRGYITSVAHHCGAGTYSTFRTLGVKQIPFPQAFDQSYNAHLCHQDYDSGAYMNSLPLAEQINLSRARVCKMLNINNKLLNVEITRDMLEVGVPSIPSVIDTTVTATKVTFEGVSVLTNNHVQDCVILTLLDEVGNCSEVCARAESLYTNFDFHTTEDVITFILLLNVNCNLISPTVQMCIVRAGADCTVNIHLNDTLTHASTFSFKSYNPVLEDGGAQVTDLLLTGDVPNDVQNVYNHLKMFDECNVGKAVDNLLLTKMRKSQPLMVFSGIHGPHCSVPFEFLSVGYKYLCISSVGSFYAICVPADDNKMLLAHLHGNTRNISIAFRLERVMETPLITHRSLIRPTLKVAINHNTRKQLQHLGKMVNNVGVVNAEVLYIYDTWARVHHHEIEREVINTAVNIELVVCAKNRPTMPANYLKKLLLNEKYPTCVNKGKVYFRLECDNDITRRACQCIANAIKLLDHLYIVPYDDKKCIDIQTIFEYNAPSVKFVHELDETIVVSTVQDIITANKIEAPIMLKRLKGLMEQFGYYEFNSALVEPAQHSVDINTLSLGIRQGVFIDDVFVFSRIDCRFYQVVVKGSGFVKADDVHIPQLDDSKFNNNRFTQVNAAAVISNEVNNMTGLLPLDVQNSSLHYIPKQNLSFHAKENQLILVCDVESVGLPVDSVKFDEIPQSQVIDFWNNEELLDSNIILPTNPKFKVTSRIQPIRIKQNAYLLMEQYPQYARPSRSKAFAEELNSITNRHGAYTNYRTVDLNIKQEVNLLLNNYMRSDHANICATYMADPIGFDPVKTQGWINKHNMPAKVLADIQELLLTGWEKTPINLMAVHGKTEQTTKLKTTRWFDEVITRSIVAAPYAVSALFADIFLEAKQRLKGLLKDSIFYSDGSTPIELAAVIRATEPFTYCVEDDLTQQDRQVDRQLIQIEMELYRLLGVDTNVLEFYRMCHENWPWKGHGISGVWDAMRLSGQVTTALGNAVTNLIVHNRFMLRNSDKICKMLFLGDDIIFLMRQQVNTKNHGTETKELYNMQSKIISRPHVGGFLSMIVYTCNDNVGICPHFKRMRHRFSVCNYTYPVDSTKEKVESRVLSYLFMIGDCDWARKIAQAMGYHVTLPKWYHQDTAIAMNALYDGEEEWQTRAHIGALRAMLEEQVVYRHKFLTWSST